MSKFPSGYESLSGSLWHVLCCSFAACCSRLMIDAHRSVTKTSDHCVHVLVHKQKHGMVLVHRPSPRHDIAVLPDVIAQSRSYSENSIRLMTVSFCDYTDLHPFFPDEPTFYFMIPYQPGKSKRIQHLISDRF